MTDQTETDTEDATDVLDAAIAGKPRPEAKAKRPKLSKSERKKANRKAHAEAQKVAAAEAAASKPDNAKAAPSVGPPGMDKLLMGPLGLQLCQNLYAMPWAMAAEATGVEGINPTAARLKAGGAALQIVAQLYVGDFAKYLPLFNLAACVGTDGLAAYKAHAQAVAEQSIAAEVIGPPGPATAPVTPDGTPDPVE